MDEGFILFGVAPQTQVGPVEKEVVRKSGLISLLTERASQHRGASGSREFLVPESNERRGSQGLAGKVEVLGRGC